MGQVIKRDQMQGLIEIIDNLYKDLEAVGFTRILPSTGVAPQLSDGVETFVFESTLTVNQLNATQPYRILIDLASNAAGVTGGIKIAVANPQQILDDGTLARFPGNNSSDQYGTRFMGQLGSQWNPGGSSIPKGANFMTRSVSNVNYDFGTVYSYMLVQSDHGIALSIWEDANDNTPAYSWFVVQSPVDKDTGAPLATDNSPIFCVYSADAQPAMRFTVNEADVFRPTYSVRAGIDSANSSAILNETDQVAIAKGNKYLITLPNRLNTERYAYTEELDMIAYTSADVISEETEIPTTLYGEASPRVYRAMKANSNNNTGMRLMMLVQGGGTATA